MKRIAEIERKTKETDIRLTLNLDGKGASSIDTGIPFLDHMFELLSAHGFIDIDIKAKGDTEVDYHHTVEDIGICLGSAINKALGDKKGITRYGFAIVPMDEALARVVIDISNRPYLSYRVSLKKSVTGQFDINILKELFKAVVNNAGITMHIELLSGADAHHVAESVFKAFARALDQAAQIDERLDAVPSTKGLL
ncbi:MAG: imidazoleglycerol-phosphate dehydratase HisB [Deltaproteobacteria bacterium]|nr:imidazoleglycerol-phosphate dehydratase HisB [Deltaproteobacteria bacterium]MBW2078772.1 imidazoleglycerol-phosphate dehydratase HisB [Deltaproteobacteria bacterium]